MSKYDNAKKLFAIQKDLVKLSTQMDDFIKDLIRNNIEEKENAKND